MIKLKNLSQEQVNEISHQVADAFYDYPYNEMDQGLIKYIPDRESMFIYMNAIVQAAYKSGLLYTTSDRHEGYLMLSGEGLGSVGIVSGMKMISAEKKAKRKFIRIEMLVVRPEYQKQGFMKRMLDSVYRFADRKGVSVILDTDDKDKSLRYEHLGMSLDRIRNCGERFHMYDLIRENPVKKNAIYAAKAWQKEMKR